MEGTAVMEAAGRVRVAGVELRVLSATLDVKSAVGRDLKLCCDSENKICSLSFYQGEEPVYEVEVSTRRAVYRADTHIVLFKSAEGSAMTVFTSDTDADQVVEFITKSLSGSAVRGSVFDQRTEEASAKQYFQFYGYLSQQQNMMQDYVRTSTFQTAILHNLADFRDKVILDVGAGTGVLSFFALQGGARMVYAVEASNMSAHCARLVQANKLSDRMKVIAGKIEEVELPEKVDVIISEPMGYMLFNERMLETYLHAKKWLKPGGKMYPTQGILYAAPFSDEALFLEQMGKTYFWQQKAFHGVDVSVLHSEAVAEYFRQPIVDTFDIRILMSRPIGHTTDFATAHEKQLHRIEIPLQFKTWMTGYMHGLAFWFDVAFMGIQTTVWLSTAPFQPLTHWYQVRLLLQRPLYVREGQEVTGLVTMVANERQSYDIEVNVMVAGTTQQSSGTYDLKNPNFRYMTTPQAPPGSLHANPTESFFDSQTSVAPPISSAYLQTHPKVTRSSVVQPGGFPHNQHLMGSLQTGTEVIPVVNGSIISPTVQPQPSPGGLQLGQSSANHAHQSSPLYQYPQPRQPVQVPHWQNSAPQHGIGVGDLGIGPNQHGVGTIQYGLGAVAHAHTNQHMMNNIAGYQQQKWMTPQPTVLASRS